MTNLVDISGMALFVAIVESGSISAASRSLGTPKATISRQLGMLEHRMGAPLISRSTRALSPTNLGRRYYERVRPIVRDAEQAQAETLAEHSVPSGTLRITATVAYGQTVLAPRLFAYQERYPAVRLDLRLSDERVNIIAGGFDLAVRLGRLDDSELISRRLGWVDMVLVASPDYLAKAGSPNTPEDLSRHRGIVTRPDLNHWTIDRQIVPVNWHISTGNMIVTKDAVCAGLGIAFLPEFLAGPHIHNGELVRLLPDEVVEQIEVTALRPKSFRSSVALNVLLKELSADTP